MINLSVGQRKTNKNKNEINLSGKAVIYVQLLINIIFSSKSRRLGPGGRAPRSIQARVSQIPEAVHQLRGGAVPRQTHRHLAAPARNTSQVTEQQHVHALLQVPSNNLYFSVTRLTLAIPLSELRTIHNEV